MLAMLCRDKEPNMVSGVTESIDNTVLTSSDKMKYYACLSINNICTSVIWD